MTRDDFLERTLRRAYRALLAAYPRWFRDEMGLDIEETFADRLRMVRSRPGRATLTAFLLSAFLDVLASGSRERLTSTRIMTALVRWQDVRYAARLLRKNPVLSLLTIVVLGGGLGVSIFTFSFLYTAMLRPIPVTGGDRIVRVTQEAGPVMGALDAYDLARMRTGISTLSDVGAYTRRQLIAGDAATGRTVVEAVAAESNMFRVTRANALHGRTFTPDDAAPGAEPVIVLAYRTWTTTFGSDTGIVGRVIRLNGVATRVIGIMPRGFGFPVAADSWIPLGTRTLDPDSPGVLAVDVYGRLALGVTRTAAQTQLQALLDRTRRDRPAAASAAGQSAAIAGAASPPVRIHVETFPMAQIGEEGPVVFGLLNLLASLILLLACINVVTLLVARANERTREMAVRLALGASRSHLVVQSLCETGMLVIAAGLLATVLASWGLETVNSWAQAHIPGNLAFWWVWHLDRSALVAAGGFVTITMAVLGAAVAARATNVRIQTVLQDSSARGGGPKQSRFMRMLVATQVATVSVLMFFGVMGGVIANRIVHIDFGFDTRNLMVTSVTPGDRQATPDARAEYYRMVRETVAQSAAIDAATLQTSLAEPNDADGADRIELDGAAAAVRNGVPRANVRAVMGPLETIGAGVQDGRAFDSRDMASGLPTAVVSASFARQEWPGISPIGQRVRLSGLGESAWRTVVGIAADVPLGNPIARDRSTLAVYVPLAQVETRGALLVFRHRGNGPAAIADVQRAVAEVDPLAIPDQVSTYDEILATSALMTRSVAKLFALCFGFALLLAVSGTYGLMAQSIGQRTREIGVRRALGATDAGIVRLLLGQGGRQLGIGAVVALPIMLAIGFGFAYYLPVEVGLAATIGVVVAGSIVAVVLAATYLPTRRALRVSPRQALWNE